MIGMICKIAALFLVLVMLQSTCCDTCEHIAVGNPIGNTCTVTDFIQYRDCDGNPQIYVVPTPPGARTFIAKIKNCKGIIQVWTATDC